MILVTQVMAINFEGVVHATRAFLPSMIASEQGWETRPLYILSTTQQAGRLRAAPSPRSPTGTCALHGVRTCA